MPRSLPGDRPCRTAGRPRTAAALIAGLMGAAGLLATTVPTAVQAQGALKTVTVARGLQHPWSVAWLPDGRMLVTERPGRLRLVPPDGRLGEPIEGLPRIDAGGQGGLLDVAIDPKFAENRLVYFSFSEPAEDGGGNSTAVARGRLGDDERRLEDVRVIFRQAPKVSSSAHFGSRLVFARDGRLFVTMGDRFSRRDDAQDLSNHIGTIARIEPDGSVPKDNPFVGTAGARPETWSFGHRNVQGAALHPQTGELWAHEHGPQGGDELNVIRPGGNYGWPRVTSGGEYGSGRAIGRNPPQPGFENPIRQWGPPSVAPSGMAFLTSDRYPGWKGNLFIGTLRGQRLLRLTLEGERVTGEEELLPRLGERIRDVRQGPDGWLYLLTDSRDGRLIRLER